MWISSRSSQKLIGAELTIVQSRIDWLKGLKENVVLGGMIPVGTGFKGLIHPLRQDNNIPLETKKKNRFEGEMRDILFHPIKMI